MRGRAVAFGATLLVLAAVPVALAADLGTAGSVSYRSLTTSVMPNDTSTSTQGCPSGAATTGVGFGSMVLGIHPTALQVSETFGEVSVKATSNDTFTAFQICSTIRSKYVTRERSVPVVSAATLKAKCPNNRHVVGGGVEADGKLIQNTYPFDSRDKDSKPDDGWKASAQGSSAADMVITAVCSKTMPGYKAESLNLGPGSGSAVVPACRKGTHVSAIGARLTGATGFGELGAFSLRDGNDADSVPDDEALVNMSNDGSNPDSEKLTGTVVCVK